MFGKVMESRMAEKMAELEAAIAAAYQSARRAILRCEKDGYVLPADKYEQWKEVEMTFDPSGMRMR